MYGQIGEIEICPAEAGQPRALREEVDHILIDGKPWTIKTLVFEHPTRTDDNGKAQLLG